MKHVIKGVFTVFDKKNRGHRFHGQDDTDFVRQVLRLHLKGKLGKILEKI